MVALDVDRRSVRSGSPWTSMSADRMTGRMRLAYGGWLRRHSRPKAAREQLVRAGPPRCRSRVVLELTHRRRPSVKCVPQAGCQKTRRTRSSGGAYCCSCGGRQATGPSRGPLFARTWEASTHTRLQSSSSAVFSCDRNIRCEWSKTPASCQRSSRRRSARSRSQAPGAVAARGSRCRARTAPPADTTGPAPAGDPVAARATMAAPARSMPITRRPRPTA